MSCTGAGLRAQLLGAALVGAMGAADAASTSQHYCDRDAPLTARQQDRLLRFAAAVRDELDASNHALALIARSGLDLSRFDQRYSHAGVSLQLSSNSPWSVRQLYYACDEQRPRLFDQGLAGFVFGGDNPASGFVSIVLLPPAPARALERAALDNAGVLQLLGASYSANAYAFGLRYQNCNQWVAELLATAWGGLAASPGLRAQAQQWLQAQHYAPSVIELGSHWLMFAAGFMPWVHLDDHPEADRLALRFRISMPASIEAFARQREPDARRVELCHTEQHIVVRHG
ncbi:MAG: DUF2145 domain-containing protein, partial [Rubrivivax sp.]|nr:DUF2145 domain-containing protein [Rubrivivax sp.]